MEVRAGYKQTEVGVIPEEWDAKKIGGEIDLLTGHPFPSNGYAESGVRLLRGSNVKRGETDWDDDITQYWPSVTPDIARYQLRQCDLVIAMDGSLVGRSFAQLKSDDLPALLLQRVARIRSKTLDVTYLTAFVGSDRFVKYMDSVKTVTAIPHISPGDIRNFTIPVPPTVEEQRAIAAALSDVDALLGGLERLIAKKRDLKQAAMQQLLTGQTRLPGFSGEWEVKRLGESCELITKGTTPTSIGREFTRSGVNFLKAESISESGTPIPEKVAFIDTKTHSFLKRSQLMEGDLLISIAGVLGRVGQVSQDILPANTNQALAIVRLGRSSDLERRFLFFYLRSPMTMKQIADVNVQAAQANISLQNVQDLAVHVPPSFTEQAAIATILSDMDAELSALVARRDKTRVLKQAMMQELLTGKIRVVNECSGAA